MGKKRNDPEYVVICREFNRSAAKIEISVIDSGVTDNLLKKLIRLRHIDTHRRYFLTTKKNYQKYGAIMKKQVETMSFHGNRHIAELGAELDKERKTENEKKLKLIGWKVPGIR